MKIQYTRKIILKNTANQITLSERTAEAISNLVKLRSVGSDSFYLKKSFPAMTGATS